MRPARSRYSVTTFDPGASEVFTQGFERRPRSTALRARIPAPIITDGLEVFVQLVIAAITTWPWSSSNSSPFTGVGWWPAIAAGAAWAACGAAAGSSCPGAPFAGGSEAGYDSATASS